MEHNLFKPQDFNQGKHAVVGDCNGIPMEERWKVETPLFAKQILKLAESVKESPLILDYGCGVGRLAKEVLEKSCTVWGVDASQEMLTEAKIYVDNSQFNTCLPYNLPEIKFNLIYCVYVLQHVPSIEMREILARIYHHLEDDGYFVFCSSEYRMSIRFDDGGFFDDRFLGVNILEEIDRFFYKVEPLFTQEELAANPVLDTMIQGGLPHPAFVYKKKKLDMPYFNVSKAAKVVEKPDYKVTLEEAKEMKKMVLVNRLAPGDILVMTNAIRDLHKAFPDKYQTDIRTPCNDIFNNNPYITKLDYNDSLYTELDRFFQKDSSMSPEKHVAKIDDVLFIDMHYPMIHSSGTSGRHFSEGHRGWLETILGIEIPQSFLHPEIYLDQNEKEWVSPVITSAGYDKPYWALNAGSKGDYTLKQYPYYQEVVNLLKDRVQFVQIGDNAHNHAALDGVIDMRGKTPTLRDLFRVIYHSKGVVTCVSLPMHAAAALKKPCVVVAGAREGTRWELYPSHQFIYVNGCLPCATYDGCWKSKQPDCTNKVGDIAKCMTLIKPEDVVRSVERYIDGGMA